MVKEIIFQNFKWVLLVFTIVFLIYFQIFLGFFQQDEWASFAINSLILENSFLGYLKEVLNPTIGHYQPFNNLALSLLYSLFHLNYFPYAAVSLLLHLLNVLLVFILSIKILKTISLAILASLLFGVSASIYQATSWVLADLGIHFSSLLALLSIIFIINYSETLKKSNLILSLTFIFCSLLFKEITIGLFIVLPISFFIFIKRSKKYTMKVSAIFIFFGILYLTARGAMYLLPNSYYLEKSITQSQTLPNLIYNFLTFPVKGLIQSIIPVDLLLRVGYFVSNFIPTEFVGEVNTTKRDIIVQKWIIEIISFTLFIIASVLLFKYRTKFIRYKKAIFFGLSLVFLNTSIFALSPERSGKITIFDSRNLYFINIGGVIILTSLIASFFNKTASRIATFFIVLMINIIILNQNLNSVNKSSVLRKKILEKIDLEYPKISQRTIFFTQSDSSYYGLPEDEKILPFQSGFGQTLIINYYSKGDIPSEFLRGRFLWGITEQGYKQADGYGFGYFRDFEELEKAIKQYKIPKESVIAYEWNSKSGELINISEEIREKI